ncbi:protein phosphatase 1L [Contarinia nasturtii]|uniref:protein phosphatase 1L n=1 Tax=Contarinia nasturtii TaxID=265458 RepID=UPI0012D3C588|nr:protein phosphatase 1L [Contarinia nasturtii]
MDDELEDKVFYQTYISHMRLLSKFAMGISPLNSTMAYIWKLLRLYCIRPEVLLFAVLCIIFVSYLHVLELWSQNVMRRVSHHFGVPLYSPRNTGRTPARSPAERNSWEEIHDYGAVYAVQGRRPRMEDRYVMSTNIKGTDVTIFGILDGHGGEFAAVFAKEQLMQKLNKKIEEAVNIAAGKVSPLPMRRNFIENKIDQEPTNDADDKKMDDTVQPPRTPGSQRRNKMKKAFSQDDDCNPTKSNCKEEHGLILGKLTSIRLAKESFLKTNNKMVKPTEHDAGYYVDRDKKINFGKMVTDLVLLTDYELVEKAKKEENVAGSTLLLAVLYKTQLIVANVGDSRGVMCDGKGNVIPMSFDHKPQQTRELKRIQEAGGFVQFKGVWRVAGILATSRALGDYPLKEKNFVIAEPDILTFELNDHKPKFIILASDGLWDTFSNEEAVAYIKDKLNEPHFGAKSITIESYNRGSVDNITVMVIVFKDGRYQIGTSNN